VAVAGTGIGTSGNSESLAVADGSRALTAACQSRVEVAAYYVVAEALTSAATHARATKVTVQVEAAGDRLRIRVHDDGVGGASLGRGSGLLGLKDRTDALGGQITW
jgi:signal transduction histidine kinase